MIHLTGWWLHRQKVVFVCKNRPELASDLSGIIYIDANKEAEMRQRLKQWLQRVQQNKIDVKNSWLLNWNGWDMDSEKKLEEE